MNPALLLLVLASPQELLVSDYGADTVHRFELQTGAPLGNLGSVPGAQSLHYGPDGHLYAAAEKSRAVLRFDGASLAPLGAFVADDPLTAEDETGGLLAPTAAIFGNDGALYVADFDGDCIKRYDGDTGQYLGDFVPSLTGGMNGPDAGMVFGPDGALYVPCWFSRDVKRFDGTSGAFLDTFIAQGTGGCDRPRTLYFRGDGSLLLTSWGTQRVLRFSETGQFLQLVASTGRPTGLVPRVGTGELLVTSDQIGVVRRYDGTLGTSLGNLVNAGGPLTGGTFLKLWPNPDLSLARPAPGQAGAVNQFVATGATPSAAVVLGVALTPASLQLAPGEWLGALDGVLVVLPTDSGGRAAISATVPAALAGVTWRLQAFDPFGPRASNLVIETF